MASKYGKFFKAGHVAAKKREEEDYLELIKKAFVMQAGSEGAIMAITPLSKMASSATQAIFVTPFEERAYAKLMEPNRRKLNNDIEKEDQWQNSWDKHTKAGIEKGHSRKYIAFEKDYTEEKRMEYIQQLNNQGKLSNLKIKGMKGLGFSIQNLEDKVFKNMIYQALDESKNADGKSYLDLLADKYDRRKEIYEANIPTGKARELSFRAMESPKNFGQFITSKIKSIFDKGDNDERLSRAIDDIASNDEDLKKDTRYSRIVETKRALENIDSTFARDAQALLNLEKEEIFEENLLIKKFNELGATGKKVETIESGDNGLYKLTQITLTTAAGEKSYETREALTNINDVEGRLMGNDLQSRSSTKAFNIAMKFLNNQGMTQLKEIIDNQNLIDGSGQPLTPMSRDITIDQYDFMLQTIGVLAVQEKGEFRLKPAEERAAEVTAIASMVKGMQESVRDAYKPYPVSEGIDDSAFFVDPSTRLQLKDLKLIIPIKKERLAYTNNKSKLPEGMTAAQGRLLAEHLSQKDAKISAQRKLQETTVAFIQYWGERESASETLRKRFLPSGIKEAEKFAPSARAKKETPLESLLKDKLQPTRTDPLFDSQPLMNETTVKGKVSPSLFTRP